MPISTKSNLIPLILILIKISIKENRIVCRIQSLIDNYTSCYIIIELYCKINAIKHQFSSAITSIKSRNSILIATWSRTLFSSCVNTYASCVSIVQLQPIWFIGVIQVYIITTFEKLQAKKHENRIKMFYVVIYQT